MSTTTAYITEHYPVTDVFVDELAKIGRLGLVARLTFTVVMPDCCNPTEGPTRQIVMRLVVPADRLARFARQLMASPGDQLLTLGDEDGEPRRLAS